MAWSGGGTGGGIVSESYFWAKLIMVRIELPLSEVYNDDERMNESD